MEEQYFANKVYKIMGFSKYAKYYSDQLGCHVVNYYYLDNSIDSFKLVDGKYIDKDGNEYEEFSKDMCKDEDILWCNDCQFDKEKPFESDCKKEPSTNPICIGITNVASLTNFLKFVSAERATEIVEKYNQEVGNFYTLIGTGSEAYDQKIDYINNKVKKHIKK